MKKLSRCGLLALLVFAALGMESITAQGTMSDDAFIELCKEGTAAEVRRALAAGANAKARNNEFGATALMCAASANADPEVVNMLLEGGADVHAKDDKMGWTALMCAALNNPNPEVVRVLLAGGADIHARDNATGGTALMWAAFKNANPEVMKVLLTNGADIHDRSILGKRTALMVAAWFNPNPEVVKVLLENGAEARAVDEWGNNAILYAQQREKGDKEKIIQILKGYSSAQSAMPEDAFLELCKKGTAEEVRKALVFDTNANARVIGGGTALMWAAMENSNPEVVKVLLAGGADANAKSEDGWTALIAAAGFNTPEVVKVLLAGGADVNAKSEGGVTALMAAAWKNPNPAVVKMLLVGGADIRAVDKEGNDAILYAQHNETGAKEKIIQILKRYPSAQRAMSDDAFLELCKKGTAGEVRKALAAGANFNARDKTSLTALMWAATKNSNPDVIKVLLESGAEVNARNGKVFGKTALMYAAAFNTNPKIMKMLLAGGADINARGDDGMTALMCAAGWNSNPEVVKVLLAGGADVRAVNKDGHDALWWTQRNIKGGKEEIIQILKKYALSAEPAKASMQNAVSDYVFIGLCENGTVEEVRKALNSGANVHANLWDRTALTWAAMHNPNPEVIKVLLAGGADIHFKNKDGVTVLMYAVLHNSNPEVVKVLLEGGADVHAVDKYGSDVFLYVQQREKGNKEKFIQILKKYESSAKPAKTGKSGRKTAG